MRVGVTGHRRFDDVASVGLAIDAVLDRHCPSDEQLEVWSALAEGADRLVAERLLARGAALVALLPLPADDYRCDFTDPASLAEFERLLALAREVRIAAPTDQTREAAYEAAGLELVAAVDLVIAVWDGASSRGRGGTAEIVDAARRVGRDVVVVPVTRDNVE